MSPLERVRFGDCILDLSGRQVLRRDRPVHLSAKAFALLELLLRRRPNAVPKAELFSELWPATVVVDANLSNLVAEVRAALGDDPRKPRLIRTVHRYGYAFVAEAQMFSAPQEATDKGRDTLSWLTWGDVEIQLTEGDHLIGRHPGSIVPTSADTVSRHHAAIQVRGEAATIEDLGSRNGTLVNEQRIDGPRVLEDGDRIRIGPLALTYKLASLATPTIDTNAKDLVSYLATHPSGPTQQR